MTNLNASTLEGRTTSVIRNLTRDICHELQFNKVNNKHVGSTFSFNTKKHQSLPMCPDLWRFFAICVGYWVSRLHELIARIAIQQFQGERSSSHRGWFLWHQPKLHRIFFSGKSHPKWCKSKISFASKLDPTTKMGGNSVTPVLIIGCLWFSYCSCLSHEVPPEHIEEEKNDVIRS